MRPIAILLVVATGPCCVAIAGGNSVTEGLADRMTREAIAAGAAGDLELREDLLMQATRVAPEHAPAHWAKGEIEVDGQWQSIGNVQLAARESDALQQYQERKAASTGTPAEHLELARWCRKQGLDDEARFHWLNVLAVDPDHREALKALDSTWIDGQLVANDQADEESLSQRERRKINRDWRTRIAGWERALAAGGDESALAFAELDAEVDESAIFEFERLAAAKRGLSDAERERNVALCEAFVRALGHLPSYEASESLTRFAVLAESDVLRSAASEQLKERPQHEYIPLLIAGLSSPLESRFAFSTTPMGTVGYEHEIRETSEEGDRVTEVSRTGGAIVSFGPRQSLVSMQQGLAQGREIAKSDARKFMTEAARLEQQVARANASRTALNERIIDVLQETTGQTLGDNPNAWREYWTNHNGYDVVSTESPQVVRLASSDVKNLYVPSQQAMYPDSPGPPSGTTNRYVRDDTPRPTGPRQAYAGANREFVRPQMYECFAAGTLVWTKTGMEAIENISQGDLVLTMDEATGERCFRPVLATTRRPPSQLMHVATGSYQLLATPGHPFWVEGVGWRMAKELDEGDRIRSAEGTPLEVRVLASSDSEQESFNLVVEGNNNYFVGIDGLLTHDNTPRDPTLVRAGTR